MATMIPEDIEGFCSDGEQVFYRFLSSVAKPNDQFLCWYSPEICDAEPDFVLFHNKIGLIVFEVKDWQVEQIREVNPKKFMIAFGGKEISCTSPHEQARGYFFKILDRLVQDGKLVNRDGPASGKPKIPIATGVVFPNINKHEYRERFGDDVIPIEKVFFWDDLSPYSDLYEPTGKRFYETLQQRFEPKFPCQLSSWEFQHLRQLLYPTIRIQTVERGPIPGQQIHEERIHLLDHHQEVLARKFDQGHHIITGPSGCGKTLVLVHQAVFLQKYNPKVERILFVCFNAALVNYIRRLLALQGTRFGADGIEILTFYELCARITGEQILHENQGVDYYDTVIDLSLEQDVGPERIFDAILVDEGQDFSDRMLQVIMKCLNPKSNILTIALDEGQEVYRTKRSWHQAGIHARGRIKRLNVVYRNTREIIEFAGRLRGETLPVSSFAPLKQLPLFPDPRISTGPQPEMPKLETIQDVVSFVALKIRDLVTAGVFPLAEIAVIYTKKNPCADMSVSLPQMLSSAFDRQGILHKWLTEDYRAKRSHDITTENVTITTIHSAKGLDYGCVFLLGLDCLQPDARWTEDQMKNLVYVAVTRAKYKLFMPYAHATPLIEQMKDALKS